MSNINPTPNNRVRYILSHEFYGSQVILEPDGWYVDDKEFSRNEDYHGIITKFSNALKFSGDAKDLIEQIDRSHGVNANIRLVREERHPLTDVWTRAYDGFLDLSTKEIENNQLSIKFNSAGLEQTLKARESEMVEPERLESMDGKVLEPLRIDNVLLQGRRILLRSLFDIEPTNNEASVSLSSNGNTRDQTVGVPLNLYSRSHEQAHSVLQNAHGEDDHGTTGIMFFAVSDVDRLLYIKLNLTFTTNVTRYDDVNHGWYHLSIAKFKNGIDYDIADGEYGPDRIVLFDDADNGGLSGLGGTGFANPFTGANNNPPKTWTVEYEGDIAVAAGESLSLELWAHADLGSNTSQGHLDIKAQNMVGNLEIVENSYFEPTQAKFILPYELANRLIEIMTGYSNAFKSKFLGRTDIGYPVDGAGSLTGTTHGFWVRGFDKLPLPTVGPPKVDNPFKPFTTSFKDFVTSFNAIWNIGLGIEKNGYDEKIVIEDLKYFYNRNVTIKLPNQAKSVKRTVAVKYYYSGLELGYEKGGEYQEAMGLDESNGRSTFVTVIDRVKGIFSKLSKYRTDPYGKEFARRKSKQSHPYEDTPYDSDIWAMDLKRSETEIFRERKWQDDFEEEPTGIFSPETATNLRFSPFNLLLRHSWVIATGLTKYPTDYIRYGSSTANSNLQTRLSGGFVYGENGNILNSELQRARFLPEFVEFEHICDFEVMQLVEGTTMINGERVQNVYGLVEFINENGQKEKGWLMNLKPNEKGKWKLLSFNR